MKDLLAWILLCFVCSAASPLPGPPVNWKKVRVLVYTKNGKGYVHKNIPAAVAGIRHLGQQYGFRVDVSDTPADFTDANLRQYNAIIFANTNNDVFNTDAQKVALMRFVQAGGGIVGIHSAVGTERRWPWFKRMMGATFVRHPPFQPLKEIIVDATHPSTSFLPKVWRCEDECYFVTEMNPDLHVLVVHDLSGIQDNKETPDFYGKVFPSVWCHEFDGGRQWYTALGHEGKVYADPVFQKHILGGLQWVLEKKDKPDYTKARALHPGDPLPY
ncbi:ThuA domain-containing protein [Chitinophaga japonensis]|uniref:Type 1 glutamine amidotransferase n=1 Tax=Chitinophaga japonensis TaxID=104662 RepID=A0A562T758_CHIJA|nr:ThuA domain-containing protein [Chitinophaga japonensis]TWI89074.1 type 1 glutamine amidotransferase [Chitinophaga japonensis]